MPSHSEIRVGSHLACVEDDLMVLRVRGQLTLEDARAYLAIALEHSQEVGYTLTLADLSQASSIPPEVRRYFAQQAKEHGMGRQRHYVARAVIGASLFVRAVAAMTNSVMQLVFGDDQVTLMVKDEPEARAWLAEQRARIRGKLGLSR